MGHWPEMSLNARCNHISEKPVFILSKMVSVSGIFFWGLAFTTLRNRKPIRFKTSAMVLGEGNCSALYPCALSACKAAWAVSRV